MPFTESQTSRLGEPLDEQGVRTRRKQGVELRYIEGHAAIDRANDIFGYHAWSYRVTKLDFLAGSWVATILLGVRTPEGELVEREDVGVGIPAVARDAKELSPDANETAIKGAVTDALKRALRTFGSAFGNSLYEKPDTSSPARTQTSPARQESSSSDEEYRECPSCGGAMALRSGTTRDGRPYSAWFCVEKCGQKPLWQN